MEILLGHLANMFVYSMVGVLLMFCGYKIIDWMIPQINFADEMKKGNISVGIFASSIILAVAAIVIAVIVS